MNEKIKSPSGQGGAGSGPGPVGSGPQTTTAGNGGGGNGSATSGGPAAPAAATSGSGPPTPNNGNDTPAQMPPHPYGPPGGGDPVMSHYHMHQQPPHPQHMPPHQQVGPPPSSSQNPGEHPQKDVGAEYGQSPLGGPPPPIPGGHHPMYGRYHHGDPGMDPYRYSHSPMQQPPPGGKPQQSAPGGGPGIGSPNRPPSQRYIPGQPQGPTPTLNSLLQSSHPPPPPQHRYTNSYDPQQPPQQQPPPPQSQPPPQGGAGGPQPPGGPAGQGGGGGPPPPQHGGPPPPSHQPHQSPYGAQQTGWAPPPRPYSPQLGPSQQYRTPPPTNTSRGQSPYPPSQGQNSGSYPSSPQQQQPQPGQQQQQQQLPQQQQPQQQQQQQQSSSGSGGGSGGGPPPPPQSSNQGTTPSQYSPYPQRYPTPPGPATGPNHRTAYTTHQYPEPNRPWPGGSSPAPSPGPGGHPLPPASPHHTQHGGPPPSSSPSHAPSPSPQPSQASPSPHQELIGQNSNDSSSGGGHSGLGSGPPGTPNPQQVMRPTPSPTGSSGSRSMSPAVAQNHPISRPSSNQSSSGPMQQPSGGSGGGPPPPTQQATQQQQQQQQQSQPVTGAANSSSSAGNSPQQGPPSSAAAGGPQGGGQQPPPLPNQNSIGSQPPSQGPGGAQGYPLPPHMHGSYKMGGQSPGPQGMLSGYPPPPPQQAQQYSQGSYPPRPQYPPGGYGSTPPPTSQASSANSMPPGSGPQQYPGSRPMPNHSGQYPPYQNWVPPSPQQSGPVGPGPGGPGAPGAPGMGNHIQGKATPPPPQGSGSPRPLNYLKQHLQHKGGYPGGGPPGGPPQGYGNGPGMHPGIPMGPPHHMGPPHGPTTMGPPPTTPPQSMMPGVSVGEGGGPPPPPPEHISQDNGLSSGSSGSASGPPHPVTSVVTTGPDGAPMDDASQQSTISNASAASGEDPQCTTPKSRKNDPYGQSHLAPPSTSPGGVGAGPHPGHPGEDYEINSPPNWARTPASPSFNSHVPQPETFRTTTPSVPTVATTSAKKSDSLCKLYEMDDNPERRIWLDKLRAFMDERRTPITACPTISKQPLDLYRLYLYVKERGGFVEVTKSKTWKDIAGLLGIGASSSAAYTLRKHYTKNLLAYECHFDRGDIDPLPIIQQIEAGTKKKSTKAASVPSPGNKSGSSNSQDSFPAPVGAANTSMDGYPSYPGNYPGTGPQPDYGAAGQMPRPPSQSNAQSPHPGPNNQTSAATPGGDNISVNNPFDEPVGGVNSNAPNAGTTAHANSASSGAAGPPPPPPNVGPPPPQPPPTGRPPYPPGGPYPPPPVSRAPGSPYPVQPGAYGQYGSGDQYNATGPPGQFGQQQGQFPPQNRNMYPPYGPEGEAPPTGSNQYGPYGNRPYSQPPSGTSQAPSTPGAPSAPGGPPQPGGPPAPGSSPYPPPGAPGQQEYYRPPDQGPQPRRHPDFVKDSQSYPGYNARPQIYGWPGGANQYRNQYPSSASPQAWGVAPPRTQAPPGGQLGPSGQQQPPASGAQWDQHRYPPQQQPPQPQQQQQQPPYQQPGQQQPPPQWTQMGGAGTGAPGTPPSGAPGSPLRPPSAGQQQRMPNSGPGGGMTGPNSAPVSGPQPGQPGAPPNSSSATGTMPTNSIGKPSFSMPPPPQAAGVSSGVQGIPPAQGGGMMPGTIGSGSQQKPMIGGVVGPPGAPVMPPQPATQQQQQPQQQQQQQTPQQPQTQPSQQQQQQQPPQQQQQQPQPQPQQQPFAPPPVGPGPPLIKKEIVFPPDSVESTTPVLYRRKRLTKADVCPVDPWRIFMAMRSGQLTECTWALDVLNVLLFDDSTVQYFGLAHLPGLLTLLLEHFQKNLAEMFSDEGDEKANQNDRISSDRKASNRRGITTSTHNRRRLCDTVKPEKEEVEEEEKEDPQARLHDHTVDGIEETYVEADIEGDFGIDSDEDEGIDLGQVKQIPHPEERVVLLAHTPNYTMMSRKGLPVRLQPAEQDIFITDGLKEWDSEFSGNYEETAPIGSNAWTYGFTDRDINKGIIDVFKSEFVDIPFARYIKTKPKDRKHKKGDNNVKIELEEDTSCEDLLNPKLESKESDREMEEDEEVEARLQQNTFNKKRRLFNNSTASGNLVPQSEPTEAKKSKLQSDEHRPIEKSAFAIPLEIKRDDDCSEPLTTVTAAATTTTNTDSDCREVDMELETITTKESSVTKAFDPKTTIRDPALVLQRRRSSSSLEDECYTRDEASLYLVNESQDSLARRCICISNIFRNMSFVPGNESILAKSQRFLAVLGRLLLLNHEHLPRTPKNRNYDRGTEEDTDFSDSCSSLQGEREWWWEYLISIRENMLVIMANIAGHLDLSRYEELIARPLIDGLLHWAVCPSAHGQDPFPSCGPASSLSPQRLALEALCKLCVTDNNVDLVIATPPHSRLEKLCAVLTRHLCRNEDQVLREFSVNLLHYLAAADSAMARTVALQSPCISYLVAFIEQAEQTALGVANQHGINYLRENPDSMGTSLDMLRRAAGTLLHLAKHPDNRSLFMQQEQRLLGLVMSHILDQQVALIISRVLFQVSRGPGAAVNSLEYRMQQKQLQQKLGMQERKNQAESKMDDEILNEKEQIVEPKDATAAVATATTSDTAKCEARNEMAPISTHANAVNEGTANSNNIEHMPSKNPSSSMIISADSENSNSSSQITPTAAFNDVSNSSTNSNSCGTAASSLSQNSTNSSMGSCSNMSSSTTTAAMHHHLHINNNNNNNNSSSGGGSNSTLTTSEQLKSNMLGGAVSSSNTTPMATGSTSGSGCSSINSNSMNNMTTNSSSSGSAAAQQQLPISAPPPPPPATTAPPSQAPTANTSTTAAVA
ncbi:trithorax group protein osa isoform X7 [Stomoxys calcitrans]|uniref:trithorax group protein osa isoform X7 n=1 Tax=Stomoxys calcitrans TaxID=35570 RepID=UPI0027E24768|nr:trithorax group protein osa isoform X7 [Stomoxys calcitrans]